VSHRWNPIRASIAQSCRAPWTDVPTLTGGGRFIVIARVPPMTRRHFHLEPA